jgi:mono/diheme cytochrome c family protein
MKIASFLWICAATAVAAPEYRRDVLPILRDYCAGCHNSRDLEGEFSVETFAALMAGGESGEPILKAGDSVQSYLTRLMRKEAKPAMPPRKEPQPSRAEIAVIEQWIDAGAHGPAPGEDKSLLEELAVPTVAAAKLSKEPVSALAVSPDGKQLAAARFGRIDLLDAVTLQPLFRFASGPGKINALHWSTDGTHLVAAGGIPGLKGVASVHNASTGALIRSFGEGHRDVLYDAEWSPDGKLLATAGYDQSIRLWDAASGQFVRDLPGHNGAIFDLAFSPDGRLLASASGDQTSKVWRVRDGERLDTLNQPQGAQFRIAFSPDGGYLIGAGADNRIRTWRLLSKDDPAINPVLEARFAHEAEVVQFGFDPKGSRLLSASADGSVKLWSLPSLQPLSDSGPQEEVVSGIAWTGNGFIASTLQGALARYAAETGPSPRGTVGQSLTAIVPTASGTLNAIDETEQPSPQPVTLPAVVKGSIGSKGDLDTFRFEAKKGEQWVLEVHAARDKSPLDSRIEVVTMDGKPIERTVLQSVRDSWFTFRGKDSDTSDDFRIHNWREMELNEYLYCNGEVVKLWHYPRGPDSGFRVYPGMGNRQTWFDTSPLSHALGEPCYIVDPLPPGSKPLPNGLPLYRIFFENDDDASRRFGKDSKLTFTAPSDGSFLARIGDVRGLGGSDYGYKLTIRPIAPDFSLVLEGKDPKVAPGSGQELGFRAVREDDFAGEIEISLENLPPGFSVSGPTTIQEGQSWAYVALQAAADAPTVTEELAAKVQVVAKAKIGGKTVEKRTGNLGKITLGPAPKLLPRLATAESIITIHPGETIFTTVVVERRGFDGEVNFGRDDSGRNLPHGVYIDNVGLNGLMIPTGAKEQRFAITAAKWVPAGERWFHLVTKAEGGHATPPVRLRVVRE